MIFLLWQIGLIGYTYMLAGHAAREGARELAIRPDRHQERTRRTATGGARGPAEGLAPARAEVDQPDDVDASA